MDHVSILLYLYLACLFLFGLNGILWIALHNKHQEIKVAEERIIKLLLRSRIRRVK
jgi:hypothetical protein